MGDGRVAPGALGVMRRAWGGGEVSDRGVRHGVLVAFGGATTLPYTIPLYPGLSKPTLGVGCLGVGCPWALGEGRVAPGALGACGGRRGAARCPIGVGLAAF